MLGVGGEFAVSCMQVLAQEHGFHSLLWRSAHNVFFMSYAMPPTLVGRVRPAVGGEARDEPRRGLNAKNPRPLSIPPPSPTVICRMWISKTNSQAFTQHLGLSPSKLAFRHEQLSAPPPPPLGCVLSGERAGLRHP